MHLRQHDVVHVHVQLHLRSEVYKINTVCKGNITCKLINIGFTCSVPPDAVKQKFGNNYRIGLSTKEKTELSVNLGFINRYEVLMISLSAFFITCT